MLGSNLEPCVSKFPIFHGEPVGRGRSYSLDLTKQVSKFLRPLVRCLSRNLQAQFITEVRSLARNAVVWWFLARSTPAATASTEETALLDHREDRVPASCFKKRVGIVWTAVGFSKGCRFLVELPSRFEKRRVLAVLGRQLTFLQRCCSDTAMDHNPHTQILISK